TNLGFLARVIGNKDYAAAKLDTGFIERRKAALLAPAAPVSDKALAAAALFCLKGDPATGDPWARRDGWRLNGPRATQTLQFRNGEDVLTVAATASGDSWDLRLGERRCQSAASFAPDGAATLTLDGTRSHAIVLEHAGILAVFIAGEGWAFARVDPLAPPAGADIHAGRLSAPMPGKVVQLLVAAGDNVRRGQPLIVIEAMKMEHTIAAPRDGAVETVSYAVGDLVEEGAELIALSDPGAEAS
ncbi:MAG TPA: biotin/lipoyl-containing protein, partial [Stellaceae bacterium]|nr:biotin/lipoyl-containing protein [Stellaceae bacterium]